MQQKSYWIIRLFAAKNSGGFSLIEVFLALIISLSLLLALFTIYFSAEKNQKIYSYLTGWQERIITVNQLLRNNLHNAGFSGCVKSAWHNDIVQIANDPEGLPNSNGLTILSVSSESELLARDMRNLNILYLPRELEIAVGEQLMITDCFALDSFIVKKISQAANNQLKITTESPISHLYKKSAEIYFLQKNTYFVGLAENLYQLSKPINSLYLRDQSGEKTALIDNVKDMQIKNFKTWLAIKINLDETMMNKTIFLDVGLWNIE